MYALVFWIRSKSISVIEEDDLCPLKDDGQETFAKYHTNNRLYKVKIVKKSGKLFNKLKNYRFSFYYTE